MVSLPVLSPAADRQAQSHTDLELTGVFDSCPLCILPLVIETDADIRKLCPPPDPSLFEEEVQPLILEHSPQFVIEPTSEFVGTLLSNKVRNMQVGLLSQSVHA